LGCGAQGSPQEGKSPSASISRSTATQLAAQLATSASLNCRLLAEGTVSEEGGQPHLSESAQPTRRKVQLYSGMITMMLITFLMTKIGL